MRSLFALLLLSAPALAADHPLASSATNHTVLMKSISFDPKVLEIPAGDSVVWENRSYTDHSATAKAAGGFDTGLVHPKAKSRAVKFAEPGEYPYKCSIHGNSMSGVIRVVAPK